MQKEILEDGKFYFSLLDELKTITSDNALIMPPLAGFWYKNAINNFRMTFLGALGSRLDTVFHTLTDTYITQTELEKYILEAHPDSNDKRILSLNVKTGDFTLDPATPTAETKELLIVPGQKLSDALVSVAFIGTQNSKIQNSTIEQWLMRTQLCIIVSPANAVAGNLEVTLMRELAYQKRKFALIITENANEPEGERLAARAEIEIFKLNPLYEEFGPINTYFAASGEDFEKIRESLKLWYLNNKENANALLARRVGEVWLKSLVYQTQMRIEAEAEIVKQLSQAESHYTELIALLIEKIKQSMLSAENHLHHRLDSIFEEFRVGLPFETSSDNLIDGEAIIKLFQEKLEVWKKELFRMPSDICADLDGIFSENFGKFYAFHTVLDIEVKPRPIKDIFEDKKIFDSYEKNIQERTDKMEKNLKKSLADKKNLFHHGAGKKQNSLFEIFSFKKEFESAEMETAETKISLSPDFLNLLDTLEYEILTKTIRPWLKTDIEPRLTEMGRGIEIAYRTLLSEFNSGMRSQIQEKRNALTGKELLLRLEGIGYFDE